VGIPPITVETENGIRIMAVTAVGETEGKRAIGATRIMANIGGPKSAIAGTGTSAGITGATETGSAG
jgi:hypothetical protein